jgi:hypothetical protein
MNPNDTQSGFELPQPVQPYAPAPTVNDGVQAGTQQSVPGPSSSVPAQSNQAVNPFANLDADKAVPSSPTPVPQPAKTNSYPSDQSSKAPTKKSLIKDKDLIDREWINRAKDVERQTRDDPYAHVERMYTLKADYLKSQFNKILKASSQ